MKSCNLQIQPKKCPTCPFGGAKAKAKHRKLAPVIALSALTEAARVCHSTGSDNVFNRRTGKRPMICRGARDLQLVFFHNIGFIDAPTDEAWEAKVVEMGLRGRIARRTAQ